MMLYIVGMASFVPLKSYVLQSQDEIVGKLNLLGVLPIYHYHYLSCRAHLRHLSSRFDEPMAIKPARMFVSRGSVTHSHHATIQVLYDLWDGHRTDPGANQPIQGLSYQLGCCPSRFQLLTCTMSHNMLSFCPKLLGIRFEECYFP